MCYKKGRIAFLLTGLKFGLLCSIRTHTLHNSTHPFYFVCCHKAKNRSEEAYRSEFRILFKVTDILNVQWTDACKTHELDWSVQITNCYLHAYTLQLRVIDTFSFFSSIFNCNTNISLKIPNQNVVDKSMIYERGSNAWVIYAVSHSVHFTLYCKHIVFIIWASACVGRTAVHTTIVRLHISNSVSTNHNCEP